jgi:hypothetical protein
MGRPTKAEQEEIRLRRIKANNLRRAGVEWQIVADNCGYSSAAAACKDVSRGYEASDRNLTRSVELLRAEEDDRLQRLLLAVYPTALQGNFKAIDAVLKISESRRKLYRLDKPEQIEVVTMDTVDREIARLKDKLADNDPVPADDPAA